MDPVTHLLGGALAGALLTPAAPAGRQRPLFQAALAGALSGVFPDIDYLVLVGGDTLYMLNNHRGYTHSLLLLPLWATLLAWPLKRLSGNRLGLKDSLAIAALALTTHILLDLITPYGTRILMPLDVHPYTLNTTFVIDLPLTAMLALGTLLLCISRIPRLALIPLAAVAFYISMEAHIRDRAETIALAYAQAQGIKNAVIVNLPQPFSAFNRKLIVSSDDGYHSATVSMNGIYPLASYYPCTWPLAAAIHSYRAKARMRWELVPKFGPAGEEAIVQQAWQADPLAPFRRFSHVPAFYRMAGSSDSPCVWFTDLRYVIPHITPPFQFGVCHTGGQWQRRELPVSWFSLE